MARIKKNAFVSALPAMQPSLILDRVTGEVLSEEKLDADLLNLVTTVSSSAANFYEQNKKAVEEELATYKGYPQPEAYARSKGWNLARDLPREVKAKSRVERLARFNLVQTVASYVLNPNPHKQAPTFGEIINLGSVDSHIVTLELEDNQLILSFKCWTGDYVLYFTIPSYILARNIVKYSLPTIRRRNGEWVFQFSVQEQPEERLVGVHKAGVDLGRVEPFTLAVLNEQDKRVAHYASSGRLKQLNAKRERLLGEKHHIQAKLSQYAALGLNTNLLERECDFKSSKATRLGVEVAKQLGAEVTKKLAKHKVSILNVEDLRWATGAKYGSSWNHSKQQEHLTHALARKGITTRRVNPKNTSQECHKCGTPIVHDSKTRTVWCLECKSRLDRDFNAAMNIARDKNKNVSPPTTGGVGVTVALLEQVTVQNVPNSLLGQGTSSVTTTSYPT